MDKCVMNQLLLPHSEAVIKLEKLQCTDKLSISDLNKMGSNEKLDESKCKNKIKFQQEKTKSKKINNASLGLHMKNRLRNIKDNSVKVKSGKFNALNKSNNLALDGIKEEPMNSYISKCSDQKVIVSRLRSKSLDGNNFRRNTFSNNISSNRKQSKEIFSKSSLQKQTMHENKPILRGITTKKTKLWRKSKAFEIIPNNKTSVHLKEGKSKCRNLQVPKDKNYKIETESKNVKLNMNNNSSMPSPISIDCKKNVGDGLCFKNLYSGLNTINKIKPEDVETIKRFGIHNSEVNVNVLKSPILSLQKCTKKEVNLACKSLNLDSVNSACSLECLSLNLTNQTEDKICNLNYEDSNFKMMSHNSPQFVKNNIDLLHECKPHDISNNLNLPFKKEKLCNVNTKFKKFKPTSQNTALSNNKKKNAKLPNDSKIYIEHENVDLIKEYNDVSLKSNKHMTCQVSLKRMSCKEGNVENKNSIKADRCEEIYSQKSLTSLSVIDELITDKDLLKAQDRNGNTLATPEIEDKTVSAIKSKQAQPLKLIKHDIQSCYDIFEASEDLLSFNFAIDDLMKDLKHRSIVCDIESVKHEISPQHPNKLSSKHRIPELSSKHEPCKNELLKSPKKLSYQNITLDTLTKLSGNNEISNIFNETSIKKELPDVEYKSLNNTDKIIESDLNEMEISKNGTSDYLNNIHSCTNETLDISNTAELFASKNVHLLSTAKSSIDNPLDKSCRGKIVDALSISSSCTDRTVHISSRPESSTDRILDVSIIPESVKDRIIDVPSIPSSGTDRIIYVPSISVSCIESTANVSNIPESFTDRTDSDTTVPEIGSCEIENKSILLESCIDTVEDVSRRLNCDSSNTVNISNRSESDLEKTINESNVPETCTDNTVYMTSKPEYDTDIIDNVLTLAESGSGKSVTVSSLPESDSGKAVNVLSLPESDTDKRVNISRMTGSAADNALNSSSTQESGTDTKVISSIPKSVSDETADVSNISEACTDKPADVSNISGDCTDKSAYVSNISEACTDKPADVSNISEACTDKTDDVSNISEACTDKTADVSNISDPCTDKPANVSNISEACTDKVCNTTLIDKNKEIIKGKKKSNSDKNSTEGTKSLNNCCGHCYVEEKSYLNHLISVAATDELSKLHEEILEKLKMDKCALCKKWMTKHSMRRHLKKLHNIILPPRDYKMDQVKFLAGEHQNDKVRAKNVYQVPVIQSVCSLKEDSDDSLSIKKDSDSISILCHLTSKKSLSVSSVSDLPFSMKPIVMLEKSLSPYKRKVGFNSVPRIVKVESLSYNSDSNTASDTQLSNNMSNKKLNQKTFRSRKHVRSPVPNIYNKSSTDETNVYINKADENLKTKPAKFCYSKSLVMSERKKKNSQNMKGNFCISKTNKNSIVRKKCQPSDGYYLQDSPEDTLSTSSISDEEINEQKSMKKDAVPTVELDLFTLPSVDEDSSVFLTDPSNPDFKVFAAMDAIFVGETGMGQPTTQLGYVTDTNNVVYINPEHFLFPNVDDSNVSLDSVKLSSEDLQLLSNIDSKKYTSPIKGIHSTEKGSSPLKSKFNKKVIDSPSKVNSDSNTVPDNKYKSILRSNKCNTNTAAGKEDGDIKTQSNIISKVKIDPIKKALGLTKKQVARIEKTTEVSKVLNPKVIIDESSKKNADSHSSNDEFVADSNDISIIDAKNTETNNINADDNEATCISLDVGFDQAKVNPAKTRKLYNKSFGVDPVIIKVGQEDKANIDFNSSNQKYIITVYDCINKALLKLYPNFWWRFGQSKKFTPLKGSFTYKPTSETYQSQFAKYTSETKRITNNSFNHRDKCNNPKDYAPKRKNNKSKIGIPDSKFSAYEENDSLLTKENGSLLDVIDIDPNREIIDLPIDIKGESVVVPKVDNVSSGGASDLSLNVTAFTDAPSNLITSTDVSSSVIPSSTGTPSNVIDSTDVPVSMPSVDVSQLSSNNLIEEEVISDDFVYIDENNVLRSPSGREITKEKNEIDEEAALINMIENYAETLDLPSSPTQSPEMVNCRTTLGEFDSPKEKYFDVLKGKSAWDTQLLFSPVRNKVRTYSSTDTASDTDKIYSHDELARKRRKRKKSDIDLFNIPFSEIPDLLSPAKSNSHISQHNFLINSPVALSPNTLSSVLSPNQEKTPISSKLSPKIKRTPDITKESPLLVKRNKKYKKDYYKNSKPSKMLFTTPLKMNKKKNHSNLYRNIEKKESYLKTFKGKKKQIIKVPMQVISEKLSKKDKILQLIFNESDGESNFIGFEDCMPYKSKKNSKSFIKSEKSPSKYKKKGIKLKISMSNKSSSAILPQSRNEKLNTAAVKRQRDDSTDSNCNTHLDNSSIVHLKGIVIKNFNETPIKKSHAAENFEDTSVRKSVSPLLPGLYVQNNINNKPSKKLKLTQLQSPVQSPDKVVSPLTKLSNSKEKSTITDTFNKNKRYVKSKLKKKPKKIHSKDIRSYFTITCSSNFSRRGNDFEGFPASVKVETPDRNQHISTTPNYNSSDIRNYLSSEQDISLSMDDVIKTTPDNELEKVQEQQLDFDGFTSTFPEGLSRLKTLQTYVDVLNMQNMFCTNDFTLPLDVMHEWDEETINHELELF